MYAQACKVGGGQSCVTVTGKRLCPGGDDDKWLMTGPVCLQTWKADSVLIEQQVF